MSKATVEEIKERLRVLKDQQGANYAAYCKAAYAASQKYDEVLAQIRKESERIQEDCPHPRKDLRRGSIRGKIYDDDYYACELCDKFLSEAEDDS